MQYEIICKGPMSCFSSLPVIFEMINGELSALARNLEGYITHVVAVTDIAVIHVPGLNTDHGLAAEYLGNHSNIADHRRDGMDDNEPTEEESLEDAIERHESNIDTEVELNVRRAVEKKSTSSYMTRPGIDDAKYAVFSVHCTTY